jgi:hypothetical protein
MKKTKPLKNAHTPNTKFGMGDFYGSGVRNPLAISKETAYKKNKRPPKSLA